jgi:WD40 repeat protein
VATASWDKTARLWDAATGAQVAVLEGHTDQVWCLAFSPDGARLATASWDTTTRLWDTANAKQVVVLEGHAHGIRALAFGPDGDRLATGSWDMTARLWGNSNAEFHRARRNTAAIKERLYALMADGINDGPDAAVARLREVGAKLTPEERRVAVDMILESCAGPGAEKP